MNMAREWGLADWMPLIVVGAVMLLVITFGAAIESCRIEYSRDAPTTQGAGQ